MQSSLSPLTGREDLVSLILTVTYVNIGDEKIDIILVQEVANISTTITFKMQFHCQKVPVASNYFYFTSCLTTHSPDFLFYGVMHLVGRKTSAGEVSYLFSGDPSPSEGNGGPIPLLESQGTRVQVQVLWVQFPSNGYSFAHRIRNPICNNWATTFGCRDFWSLSLRNQGLPSLPSPPIERGICKMNNNDSC